MMGRPKSRQVRELLRRLRDAEHARDTGDLVRAAELYDAARDEALSVIAAGWSLRVARELASLLLQQRARFLHPLQRAYRG